MKILEALALNNVLSEVRITGDGISRETRAAVMKSKIALSAVAAQFDSTRAAIAKEVEALEPTAKEMQFRELLSSQLEEMADTKLQPLSEEALNTLLDKCDLKTSEVELLYKHLTDKQWN